MSRTYTTLSREGYTYLIGLIRNLANVSEGIDDLHLRSDGTFSSVKIDTLLNTLQTDCNEYTDRLVANLSRLELKIANDESEISQPNIMYLYKPSGSTSYEQYVVIEGVKILLGTCDIDMGNYYTITQADAKFVLKTDFDSLKTEVERKVNKTDIVDNLTSTDTNKPLSANQGKILDDKKLNKADISTIIDSSSTDDKIPSGKAVFDAIHEHILMTLSSASDITALLTKLKSLAPGTNATIRLFDDSGVLFPVTGNYIGTVSVINGNEITVICVNHWYPQYAYIFRVQTEDTTISLNKICTTKVADVPWTPITPTSVLTRAIIRYRVKHGICYVKMDDVISSSMSTNNQIIVTGLPKPEDGTSDLWYQLASNVNSTTGPIQNLLLRLDNNGNIINYYGTNDVAYFGSFSYPVAES